MNSKERFLKAINHEEPDRIPVDARFTPESRNKLIDYFGLDKKYGEAIRSVSTNGPEVDPLAIEMEHDFLITHVGPIEGYYQGNGNGKYVDDFGIVRKWVKSGENAMFTEIVDPPLQTYEDVDKYKLPDFADPKRYQASIRVIDEYGKDFGIMGGIPCTLFELAWYLRGLQQFLIDWICEPQFVHDYLNKLKAWALLAGNTFAELGVDVIWIGDDVGDQDHMLVSPDSWREYIKPIYVEFFESWRRTNPDVKIRFTATATSSPLFPI